jgi:hypothetical protein
VREGVKMKVWIARDSDGDLYVYEYKPKLSTNRRFFTCRDINDDCFEVAKDDPIGEGITFENSPQEIELVKRVN